MFKFYIGFSILGNIFDFFNFIVILAHFGRPGEEYQEITLMLLATIFGATNMYWFGYAFLLQYKFPAYISKYLLEAVRPFGVVIEKKIQTWEMVAKDRTQRLGTSIKNKV